MIIQKAFGRSAGPLGLAAAATLAVGLLPAGPADAAPAHPSASVANDVLTVLGTGGGDDIAIALDADPGSLFVDFGNGTLPQSFDRGTFSAVAVFLRGGDDRFRAGTGLADEALTVHGGAGNDNLLGGDGTDVLFGGAGADIVDGGRGNDTEILGAGADTAGWNPGEGNDLVTGDGGYDTLAFNGSNAPEIMSLSANGHQAVLRRDVANIRMDLDGVEAVQVAALGGTDTLTVNDLSGTDVAQAHLDLSAVGAPDAVADTVIVNGTNLADQIDVGTLDGAVTVAGLRADTVIAGADTFDRLQVNAGGGNDRVRVSPEASAAISVSIDLGTGQR